MLMKVFNKGQVVIPIHIRKTLGIEIGDMVEVDIALVPQKQLILRKPRQIKSAILAGCFSNYKNKSAFPSREQMHEALAKGLLDESR